MGGTRVVVIGAGSTGAATAHDLALRGVDVIVVERSYRTLHRGGRLVWFGGRQDGSHHRGLQRPPTHIGRRGAHDDMTSYTSRCVTAPPAHASSGEVG